MPHQGKQFSFISNAKIVQYQKFWKYRSLVDVLAHIVPFLSLITISFQIW